MRTVFCGLVFLSFFSCLSVQAQVENELGVVINSNNSLTNSLKAHSLEINSDQTIAKGGYAQDQYGSNRAEFKSSAFDYMKETDEESTTSVNPYDSFQNSRNTWVLEVNAGQSIAQGGYAQGVYSTDRNDKIKSITPNYIKIGARLLLNDRIGVKADVSFDNIETKSNTSSWSSEYYRLSLRGCANITKVIGLKTLSDKIGLLINGGFAFCYFNSVHYSNSEFDLGLVYGITPYYKINQSVALNLDFNFQKTYRKHLNWDGSMADKNQNLSGNIDSFSLGVMLYF